MSYYKQRVYQDPMVKNFLDSNPEVVLLLCGLLLVVLLVSFWFYCVKGK